MLIVFSDNKASFEYIKHLKKLITKFDLNYNLFSKIYNYAAEVKVSTKY